MNSIQKTLPQANWVRWRWSGSNFGSKRANAGAHASINFDYSEKLSIIMNKWNKWGMPTAVFLRAGGAQLSAPFP